MHCIVENLSNLKVESSLSWQTTKDENKTDPESDVSLEDKEDTASVDPDEAPKKTTGRRRRPRARRRRRKKTKNLMVIHGPGPITILKPPRVAPFVPGSVGAQRHPFVVPAPTTARPHWTVPSYSTNHLVIGQHLALDCEMVGVGPFGRHSVLARVSVVNWNGHVVLDTFVKVKELVTDYRTFVSGVRPCDLESAHAMEFEECRQMVHQLLQNKILVGHGLTNDLEVLRLSHPWHRTRDTSTYEPFMHSGGCHGKLRARKLKELAESQLGRVIQGDEHDSIEDARCAMELYKSVQQTWEFSMKWQYNMEANTRPSY